MTNAEKYKEVFRLEANYFSCPTLNCSDCPMRNKKPNCSFEVKCSWWNEEYKESE